MYLYVITIFVYNCPPVWNANSTARVREQNVTDCRLAKGLPLIQGYCGTVRRDLVIMEILSSGDIGRCISRRCVLRLICLLPRGCVTADILMQLAVAGLEHVNGFESLRYALPLHLHYVTLTERFQARRPKQSQEGDRHPPCRSR